MGLLFNDKKIGLYIVLIIVFITISAIAVNSANKQVDETTAYTNIDSAIDSNYFFEQLLNK